MTLCSRAAVAIAGHRADATVEVGVSRI